MPASNSNGNIHVAIITVDLKLSINAFVIVADIFEKNLIDIRPTHNFLCNSLQKTQNINAVGM